jgi:hypothetical protein
VIEDEVFAVVEVPPFGVIRIETLPEDENLQEEVTLPEGLTEDIDALNDEVSGEAETIDGDTFEAMLQGID